MSHGICFESQKTVIYDLMYGFGNHILKAHSTERVEGGFELNKTLTQ